MNSKTETRLVDANVLEGEAICLYAYGGARYIPLEALKCAPTVDVVEASRLGDLGRLMMPYNGCPRGRMGARGDGRIIELDPIKDVEGDIWVPVLEEDLNALKARAAEVVHGQWFDYDNDPMWQECSACGYRIQYSYSKDCKYCPNCGAKMESGNKDGNV